MHPTPFPRSTRSRGAFTLIELLTVIAIIGILAAILIPVVGRVRESAKSARCVTNLRQTGVAIQGYVTDNKGFLPSVGHTSVGPYFTADPRNFQQSLLPYISVFKSTSWNTATLDGQSYAPTLECPSYKGAAGTSCYTIRDKALYPDGTVIKNANGSDMIPWARMFQIFPSGQFLVTQKAMQLSAVPANVIAILDRIPTATDLHYNQPNHANYQNALYFDLHVAKVPTP